VPVRESQTLLVLGAGASVEYGFPSGGDLLQRIINDLGTSGSRTIEYVRRQEYRHQVEPFRTALILARPTSVDVLLERRAEFLDIGKACIAAALIPCEASSNLQPVARTWYDELLDRLTDAGPDGFHKNRLSIVTFNYDRSLEHYLFTALQHRWGLSDEDCVRLMKMIPIVHIHGQLGAFPPLADGTGRPYGAALDDASLQQAMAEIRIIHEGATSASMEAARGLIEAAGKIAFLGFGYHPTNVERLGVIGLKNRYVSGTAFGLLGGEQSRVRAMIATSPSIDLGHDRWDVRQYLREKPILT